MPEYINHCLFFKVNEKIRSKIKEVVHDFDILVDLMSQDITNFNDKYDDVISTLDSMQLDKVSSKIKLFYLYMMMLNTN